MERLLRALLTLGLIALAHPTSAQTYPAQRITFIVAFAPGGVADTIARLVGQGVEKRLGQNVVIENRGGAGGNIAASAVAQAAPDGYTVLATTTALAINETLRKNSGFSARDFRTVAISASSPESFIVNPSNPANSVAELVKAAKTKSLNFGTAGVGTGPQIGAEYFFKEAAKLPPDNVVHVPFQGGAPATNAILGNQIDMLATTYGGGGAAQVAAGKLKGIGLMSEKRAEVTPNVPTFAEGGYPDYFAASWVGFFVPARTDAAVVGKLNAAIDATIKDAAVQERLKALSFDPITGPADKADAYFQSEVAKWGKMVSALKLEIK
jgi:tripartite-type tricarboxylate transporter receptor subunit TctC